MADLPKGILDEEAFADRMVEIHEMLPRMTGAQYVALISALHASAWPRREDATFFWNLATVEIYRAMRAGTWPQPPNEAMGEAANERPI